jgi:hypothetical protein
MAKAIDVDRRNIQIRMSRSPTSFVMHAQIEAGLRKLPSNEAVGTRQVGTLALYKALFARGERCQSCVMGAADWTTSTPELRSLGLSKELRALADPIAINSLSLAPPFAKRR